jgi:hypothetical protein
MFRHSCFVVVYHILPSFLTDQISNFTVRVIAGDRDYSLPGVSDLTSLSLLPQEIFVYCRCWDVRHCVHNVIDETCHTAGLRENDSILFINQQMSNETYQKRPTHANRHQCARDYRRQFRLLSQSSDPTPSATMNKSDGS